MSTQEAIRAPRGLENVIVDQTRISGVDPSGQHTIYRGYTVSEIAENTSFEEAAYLFLYGRLPTRRELGDFTERLAARREIPDELYEVFKLLPSGSHPLHIAQLAVAYLGMMDERAEALEEGLLIDKAESIIAKMPTIFANGYRATRGMDFVRPDPGMPQAKDLLRMITGRQPSDEEARLLEVTLVLYMDHGFNASTFTTRVVASTLSDIYSAVVGGLGALKGPLHGGANEKAMQMLLEIGIGDIEGVKKYLEEKLARKERIMGFGHRVYKTRDPRVPVAKKYLARYAGKNPTARKLLEMCEYMEKLMWDYKRIPANIDFYTGPIYYVLGVPIPLYTPLFASARVVGWVSHYIEQVKNNKLIRPKAEYVGPVGLKYVPLDLREGG